MNPVFIVRKSGILNPPYSEGNQPKDTMEVVPTGIPLIVGPAVLTLLMIIVHTYGQISTMLCLILNFLVVWLVFNQSQRIMRLLKEGGALTILDE